MSRRAQIHMTDDEVHDFLARHRTVHVATMNPDRMPHLVAMWYGLIEGEIAMWTYAKSQKAANLRRSPKIACLVETGERYEELQGVSITGIAAISDDPAYVRRVGEAVLFPSPTGGQDLDAIGRELLVKTAAKRIAITVTPTKVVSWDHRKLGGRY